MNQLNLNYECIYEKKLFEEGLITEAEYNKSKNEILNELLNKQ